MDAEGRTSIRRLIDLAILPAKLSVPENASGLLVTMAILAASKSTS